MTTPTRRPASTPSTAWRATRHFAIRIGLVASVTCGAGTGCGGEPPAAEPIGSSGGQSTSAGGAVDGGGGGTTGASGGVSATGGRPPIDEPFVPRPLADDITVSISGRQILVNGEPLHIRGVCWNPVGRGGTHPEDLDYAGFASTDIPLMRDAGINAVRTYSTLTNRAVLDQLQAAGIFVLNNVYTYGGSAADSVVGPVNAIKDHPAVLMWVLGNEWNYNGLYVGMTHQASLDRLNEVAGHVRSADPSRPIASVYGELPNSQTINAMPNIDVWGINAYRNIGFGSLFDDWGGRSGKPMFMAEYGADAWNSITSSYDPSSQAHATSVLTELIVASSVVFSGGVVSGGTIFEWADEWWKAGEPDVHDAGGSAPGGGPYPDNVFNEEWWGVVDIDRNPRPAYDALQDIYTSLGPTPGAVAP